MYIKYCIFVEEIKKINENKKFKYKFYKEEYVWKIEKYGNYNLQSIEKYYEFLKKSTREKDKSRIPLIEKYMKNR